MRIIRSTTIVFASVLIFATVAFAQAPQQGGKVGLIDLDALGREGGITKYVNALNALDKEFAPEQTKLQTLANTIKTKTDELQKLVEQAKSPGSPVSNSTLVQRNSELESLKREAKFKQEDLQAKFKSRQQEVVGPVFDEMLAALREFTVKNGYSMILDGAKLEQSGLLLSLDSKYNVTKDFIAFFNARPASSSTTP